MFCRNCGNEMMDQAAVCVKCGVSAGQGISFCPQCGGQTPPGATFCTNCGVALQDAPVGYIQKSRLAAGLLGIFLGAFGIHNFYLGFKNRALIQLLVSVIGGIFTCGIATTGIAIWGLVEGILLLTDSSKTDAMGQPLKD